MVGGFVAAVRMLYKNEQPEALAIRVCNTRGTKSEWCCVHVYPTSQPIDPGDKVWWQGDYVLWTPKDMRVKDHRLDRKGYSHDDVGCRAWRTTVGQRTR